MTARYALAMSLNNATVKLAEEVGYDKVADLAKAAGIASVKATPAMALGAYDATPIDMAAAYTVFANSGDTDFADRGQLGAQRQRRCRAGFQTGTRPGARSARRLLMTNMMEGVMNFGTAYAVRAAWLHHSRCRQDRQLARWMVRRLHQQPVVHRLGGLRRLQRSCV